MNKGNFAWDNTYIAEPILLQTSISSTFLFSFSKRKFNFQVKHLSLARMKFREISIYILLVIPDNGMAPTDIFALRL